MAFATSGTAVELPGGLVLADGRVLTHAELRPLTGREEDWLATHPAVPSAVAVTHLLSSCLVLLEEEPPSIQLIGSLLVGDRDYLMLQLRRLTLGEHFQAVFRCPACDARMDVDFDSADVPVEARPQAAAAYTLEIADSGGSGRVVRFRLPTGADQEAVLGVDPVDAPSMLLKRCLLDDIGSLAPEEQLAVEDAMERLAPRLDIELDVHCPDCNRSFLAPFDATAFFLGEVKMRGRQLLREVHALACYYHWSETEIMNLRCNRRRDYLALLSDSLLQT
jgi:hypothetical protein